MNKNAILTTFLTIFHFNLQLPVRQYTETPQINVDSMQRQLDETCNIVTTSTDSDTYTLTVVPVDETKHCTHFFKYFAHIPKNDTWYNFQTDSTSSKLYNRQIGFSKNVTYRVQHYVVSKDNNNRSQVFEADFILKKPVIQRNSEGDILDMLSQRNIEAISNTDSEIPVYCSSIQSIQNTSKPKMKY